MLKVKVTQIGNSTGIVLPKEALGKLKVHKGDHLYLIETPDGFEMTPYDELFIQQMELAEKIMHEDRDLLKILSKK